jgi:hypothetical protein
VRHPFLSLALFQYDINIIFARIGKEHKQIVKFATRWVEGLRAIMRAWEEGDEYALVLRQKMRTEENSDEIKPWYGT